MKLNNPYKQFKNKKAMKKKRRELRGKYIRIKIETRQSYVCILVTINGTNYSKHDSLAMIKYRWWSLSIQAECHEQNRRLVLCLPNHYRS